MMLDGAMPHAFTKLPGRQPRFERLLGCTTYFTLSRFSRELDERRFLSVITPLRFTSREKMHLAFLIYFSTTTISILSNTGARRCAPVIGKSHLTR